MAAVTTAVAVGIAAAGAIYTADQARRQADAAKDQAKEIKNQTAKQEQAAAKQRQELESQEETADAREQAVNERRRALASQNAARGRAAPKGGTLLTSPLAGTQLGGTVDQLGDVSGQGVKTLLGS